MTALLLSGKDVAQHRRSLIKEKIQQDFDRHLPAPKLAVILVGADPASSIYVENKKKACQEVGIESLSWQLPADTAEQKLLELIDQLNADATVHGILVQLPLPAHIDTTHVIERINPNKDVDGFHPYNVGRLAQRLPRLRPCTPLGIMNLLDYYQISVKRKHAVVIGASNIVGRPMSMELLLAGATVTICHKFTQNLAEVVAMADLIVVATGIQDVLNPDWLQAHQVLIDVGIHRLADGQLRGDVDFAKAKNKVAAITPVPGGVGPMTICTLLENTLLARGYQ